MQQREAFVTAIGSCEGCGQRARLDDHGTCNRCAIVVEQYAAGKREVAVEAVRQAVSLAVAVAGVEAATIRAVVETSLAPAAA